MAGEPCAYMHIVASGTIRVRRLSLEGREYVLEYILPGQAFNLAAALDGGTNLANGEALTRTTTYAIPCDRFRQFVRDHPSVAAVALTRLSGQVRHLSDTVEDLALHTVRARLARFLLREGMRYLRDRGLAYAELEMDSTNAPALALYKSLGYRVFKEEVSLGLPLNGKEGP